MVGESIATTLMPRLTDPWFEAEFVGEITSGQHVGSFRRIGTSIDGAQALFLYGPCSYGQATAHGVIVPFANPRNAPPVPPDFEPVARWQMSGSGLHDLTLIPSVNCAVGPGAPEFNLKPGECRPGRVCWHGFITNGEVT